MAPRVRRLLLHIGTEKTGTTSAQRWATEHRDLLAARGLLYPTAVMRGAQTAHHLIPVVVHPYRPNNPTYNNLGVVTEADWRALSDSYWDTLREEVETADCPTVLLSSELMSSRFIQPGRIADLKACLEGLFEDIEVILHLRPQIDVATSLCSTAARVGRKVDTTFFDNVHDGRVYYNYAQIYGMWAQVFGEARMRVIPFRRRPAITPELLAAAGIDTDGLPEVVRQNEGLSVPLMALLNTIRTAQTAGGARFKVPPRVIERIAKGPALNPGEDLARTVQARFDASNAELCAACPQIALNDLEPDWAKYQGPGNLHLLDETAFFGSELVEFLTLLRPDLAL